MRTLRGKSALVTGASRGIGPHITEALAREGVHLLISARDSTALEERAAALRPLGVDVRVVAADLQDRRQVESLAHEAAGVDILVNNAAIECAAAFDTSDPDDIQAMIQVNLLAPMLLTRLLLPHLIARGEGHIVNMASLAGLFGTPYEEGYSATKHGVVGFSRSLALTLKAEGHPIGVSVICPGFVDGAGMYHEQQKQTGATAPAAIGTVAIPRLVKAILDAIRKNKPEVVISGMPMRPFMMTQALSPKAAAKLSAVFGVPKVFKRWADGS